MPCVLSTGYIRLVFNDLYLWYEEAYDTATQRVVVVKDRKNKMAHEKSAQTACEAAGSIRTVASLTREEDCLQIYSKSLEEPLHNSNSSAFRSNLLYGFSQAMSYWVIALIFWYGSKLVANQEYTVFRFFVGLMVMFKLLSWGHHPDFLSRARRLRQFRPATYFISRVVRILLISCRFSPMLQTFRRQKALHLIYSISWTRFRK